MKLLAQISQITLLFIMISTNAQRVTIAFETNGSDTLATNNPFKKFIGEWTLKDDSWTQNWGGITETIKIPKHHTISTQINTANSLFSIIDGPQPNGHIFWSYNPVTKKVNHLSSFGYLRAGVGEGSITQSGNLNLRISFEGEPKGTYRIYNYNWVNGDEYHMKSVQYDSKDRPTGLFYEGTFVRLKSNKKTELKSQIEEVLSVLDNNEASVEEQLKVYDDKIVHMAPGSLVNLGKEALGSYLKEQRKSGQVKMKHHIVEIEEYDDVILMRGQVKGTFYPKDESPPSDFQTKNLFVFVPSDGVLKIKKVIYNASSLK